MIIKNLEYIYIYCAKCDEKVKIAKNKGADWTTDYPVEWLSLFLLMHNECSITLLGEV